MKIDIHVQERASGKTRDLVNEFYEDPENTWFIRLDDKETTYIEYNTILVDYRFNIFTVNNFYKKSRGRKYPKLILIDDYLLVKNKIEFHEDLLKASNNETNILIKTSSDKVYSKFLIDFIRANNQLPYGELINILIKEYPNFYLLNIDKIDEYYYNFLTWSSSTIHTKINLQEDIKLKEILRFYKYQIEFKNNWLI